MYKKTNIKIILWLIIFTVSFFWIFINKWYLTNGGDAEWYIYMTNKYIQNQWFIFQDKNLANFIKKYWDNYHYEDYFNSFVSNRYKLLNNDWFVAPRYPIWLALISWNFVLLDKYFWLYFSNSVYFSFLLLIFYLLIISILELLKKNKEKKENYFLNHSYFWFIWALLIFSFNSIFQYNAMGQIMREIPSILFTLLVIFLLLKYISSEYEKKVFLLLAIFFYWIAIIIRETNILLWIIFLPFLVEILKNKKLFIKSFLIFLFSVFSYIVILIKVSFLTTLLPIKRSYLNIDHIDSFSVNNFFNHYSGYLRILELYHLNIFNIIVIAWIFFMFSIFLKKHDNWKLIFFIITILLYWFLTFILFSSWPNPYNRYIMPIFPIIFLFYILWIYYLFNYKKNYLIFPIYLIIFTILNVNFYFRIIHPLKSLDKREYINIIEYVKKTENKYIYIDKNSFLYWIKIRENWHALSSVFPEKVFIYSNENPEINKLLIEYVNRLNNK